jgi:hypothetical protein
LSNPTEPRGSEDTIIKTDDKPKKMRDKRIFVCRIDSCSIMSWLKEKRVLLLYVWM